MAQGNRDQGGVGTADPDEDSPNMIVYRKIEDIVGKMQDEKTGGVPVRTVKSFLSKIPSVVTGTEVVQWLMKTLSIEDPGEAIHLGSLIAAQGYVFPISDHVLTLKDDGTFYRFQAPYFWPSNCWEPENTDYAIYLCKRTMQNKARLELQITRQRTWPGYRGPLPGSGSSFSCRQRRRSRSIGKRTRRIARSWTVRRGHSGTSTGLCRAVSTPRRWTFRKCRREKNPQKVKKSVYGVTEEAQSQSPVHTPLATSEEDHQRGRAEGDLIFTHSAGQTLYESVQSS
ncbi:hypothetical protein SKAU_G00337790 [Synaphobranchus kaupii]|uniref:DEP domain-containing protein n=1 Tax=Synaphobranchus kaupii TaxID=118154 RepID=A0A9Q1IGY1_SYNKA|nr:hypothetical protein SKAU_G00337790 [Synaphobranchus kaupii]